MFFYSPTTRGFYPADGRHMYEDAGTWPDDAIELSADEYRALFDGTRQGKLIEIGPDGRPVLTDPPPPPLDQVKSRAISTINNTYQTQITSLVGNAPEAERATWPLQQAAAEAYLSGTATPEQMALLESLLVGDETVDVLVDKIVRKAAEVQHLIGVTLGIKRRGEKAVEAAASNEEVEAALADAHAEMSAAIAALQGAPA